MQFHRGPAGGCGPNGCKGGGRIDIDLEVDRGIIRGYVQGSQIEGDGNIVDCFGCITHVSPRNTGPVGGVTVYDDLSG